MQTGVRAALSIVRKRGSRDGRQKSDRSGDRVGFSCMGVNHDPRTQTLWQLQQPWLLVIGKRTAVQHEGSMLQRPSYHIVPQWA